MATRILFVVIAAAQLAVWPAIAQLTVDKDNAHHYRGGPKTEVPHSKQHTQSGLNIPVAPDTTNGHHYSGGPKTEVPHHMGKKE